MKGYKRIYGGGSITIPRPDDFHVHFRQGSMLSLVVPYTARVFQRALVMPNTTPPIRTAVEAESYKEAILSAVPVGVEFEPLMTLKLLRSTLPEEIGEAKRRGVVAGKFYPEGATTNSDDPDATPHVKPLWEVFAAMEEQDMVLCLHGEDPVVFSMDREREFLSQLKAISEAFPKLRVVLEHVTTEAAVQAVQELPDTVAATITAHHLYLTLDDIVGGSLDPHAFCKPIAKRPTDRQALMKAAMSGNPKFFFGSDTAPHQSHAKRHEGCAGIFSAPCALEAVTAMFDSYGHVDTLSGFMSQHGADFYKLPRNQEEITLTRQAWQVPESIDGVVPFRAGEEMPWKVVL